MKSWSWATALSAVGLVVVTASTAQATPIPIPTRAAFDAAFTETRETWDSFAPGTIFPDGTTTNGITYTSSVGDAIVTNAFLSSTSPNTLGRTGTSFFLAGETITFSFGIPLMAFGIDSNTFATANGGLTGVTNTGENVSSFFDPFPGFTTGQFLGFSTDVPFTSITLSSTTLPHTLDTLRFVPAQDAAPIPEPASLILIGTGLAAAAARRRFQRR